MGKESDDIDIALDNIHGEDFAKYIREYINKDDCNKIVQFGVIKANAEKSKHLETAAIKIHDVFIDLVNLRSEEIYTLNSSDKLFGTPKEDAFRRDLTINSLFYNINQ